MLILLTIKIQYIIFYMDNINIINLYKRLKK